jgi:hypothetical protein
MATTVERLGIVETKVENLNEKVDEIKVDIRDMHDCLDNTRDMVLAQLNVMTNEYRTNAKAYYDHADKLNDQQSAQHAELAGKISELEKFKQKWIYMTAGGAIVLSWVSSHIDAITKFFN